MTGPVADLKRWLVEHGGWKSMEAILDTLDALVLVLDRQGNVVLFNQACVRLTGYDFDEVKDRPFFEIFLIPEEIEPVKEVFGRLSAGMFPNQHENYWVTKTGDRRLIAWSNTALTEENGDVAYVVGTGIDMTEKQAAEEKIRQSEQDFRMIADYTYDCEQWFDTAGKLRYISPACRRITGFGTHDFYEDAGLLKRIIHPDDLARYKEHAHRTHRPDAPLEEIEYRIVHKDGGVRWITHGCQSVFNANGEWLGRRASNRDDTARKQAEDMVRRSAISRGLVGDMFRDLQKISDLRDGDLFNAGKELSNRVDSPDLEGFLETFTSMGMGELSLVYVEEDRKRWIFAGDKLMECNANDSQPTGHYTRGFLCGSVSRVAKAARVAGVETNCQSMGDDECRFVVQVLK